MLKRLFTLKSPIFIALLVTTMGLFAVGGHYNLYTRKSCEIAFSLITPEPISFSIYYNIGKGFNQKQSQTKYVEESGSETRVAFCIPVYNKLLGIRFDPGTIPIEMELTDITLSYSDGELFRVPFETLLPGEQIASHTMVEDTLRFTTTTDASDPLFYLTKLQEVIEQEDRQKRIAYLLQWLGAGIVCCFVGRFIYLYFFLAL